MGQFQYMIYKDIVSPYMTSHRTNKGVVRLSCLHNVNPIPDKTLYWNRGLASYLFDWVITVNTYALLLFNRSHHKALLVLYLMTPLSSIVPQWQAICMDRWALCVSFLLLFLEAWTKGSTSGKRHFLLHLCERKSLCFVFKFPRNLFLRVQLT